MKILLLQDIKGFGRKMEVKTVSDGYARNFLIPRKLAIQHGAKEKHEKEIWDETHIKQTEKRKAFAERLKNEAFTFNVRTGERGEVYESVNKGAIQKLLSNKGFVNADVVLVKPLKQLGEHSVEINFGEGIRAEAKIVLHAIT
jgi:large subunit ribosomal protein L9